MTQHRLVELFEGKPVTELNWRELLRYNVALTFTEIESGILSGNLDGGIAAKHGITWAYETPQEGQRNEKR